jgi:uncharacterized protein (DUF433 family)
MLRVVEWVNKCDYQAVPRCDMSVPVSAPTTYRFLAARSGSVYRELFVCGTSLRAQSLVSDMENEGLSVEEIAAAYRIPAEAVQEAVHYVHEKEEYLANERCRSRAHAMAKGYLRQSP